MTSFVLVSLTFIFIACWQLNANASEPSEPSCYSRFDYDEKLLLKLLKIEQEMEAFRRIVDEFKAKETELAVKRKEDYKVYEAARTHLKSDNENLQKIFNDSLAELSTEMKTMKTELATKITTQATSPVLFTVKEPKAGPSSDEIAFEESVLIEGAGFDMSTGKFTCTIPGIYYFSVYLVKLRSSTRVDLAYCKICKNASHVVKAYIDPDDGADIGSYGVANAAYVRLGSGDVVNLCGCSDVGSLDGQSSFSGRLLYRE